MDNSTHCLIGLFDSQVPSPLLEDSVRSLQDCYKRAFDECKARFPKDVAHDLRPILRRAEFENEWRVVVQQYPGVMVGFFPNAAKNCYHTLITCGRVILTESFVDARVQAVRRAMFRDTYARHNQGYLFPDMAPPTPPADAPLYAILMHDADPDDESRLLYADIILPDPDGVIVARIRLAERFPYLFVTEDKVHEEVVKEDIEIEIHDAVKEKRKDV